MNIPLKTRLAEDVWIGHTILGDQLRLSITGACPRCAMTTLAQADLAKESDIVRTAAQHHHVSVGVTPLSRVAA